MILLTIMVYFILTAIYDLHEAEYYSTKVQHYEKKKIEEKKLKELQEIKKRSTPKRKATRSRTVVDKKGYRNETVTVEE